MELHLRPSDVLYLAGTCATCAPDSTAGQVDIQRRCGHCHSGLCLDCIKLCDCCEEHVCKECLRLCAVCEEWTCKSCLDTYGRCTYCRDDDNARCAALADSHNVQYNLLDRGSWYLLTATILGTCTVILWLFGSGEWTW